MTRIAFRLARDLGMPVAELAQRVSWAEALHWVAFYTWEVDQQAPPGKRPIRARTPAQGAAALDSLFHITRRKG